MSGDGIHDASLPPEMNISKEPNFPINQLSVMKGRNAIIICVVAAVVFVAGLLCGLTGTRKDKTSGATVPEQVQQRRLTASDAIEVIRQESKLYSAEQTAHKNIVISTKDMISVLGYKFTKPWSQSTYVIPIDVTYKACIDLGRIADEDIKVNASDSSVTITLPDPVIELTSCEVRHKDEIINQQIFASNQSQEFFNKAVSDGERGIWTEVSLQRKQDLLTDAKRNAESILADALLRSGFR